MGWTIAGAGGWRRAMGGVALAFAALAGSHDSGRGQTFAHSAGTTLSPPYSTLAAINRLPVTITSDGDVCDRTKQVRDAIVATVMGVTDCGNVTVAHLAAITTLSLRSGSIMALAAGDFAGLTSLKMLRLDGNQLTSLPDSVFAGLTELESLYLHDNQLTSLPDGVFAGLTELEMLHLDDNRLTSLPDTVFGGLTSLKYLYLQRNHLTSLPDGVFAGLTSLTWLWLYDNQLTFLPDGIFAGLTSLDWLLLGDNQLTSLPDGVFAGLTSLERLVLDGNRLTSLPDGVFAGLTSLEALWLSKNRLTSLPDGVFAGLTSLKTLGMTQNHLTSLPDGVFAGLAALETLVLYRNRLSVLSADVFAGLTSLEMLVLHDNRLTSLPDGVFAGLTSLATLRLERNSTHPLPLAVTLEKVGESGFKAVAPTGAPFEFVLPVSAANGSIEGDSTAIRIPAGAVESGPLGVTRGTDTTAAVTVDIDSVPGLPSGHSGYALEKDGSLPQTILLSASTGVTLSVSPDRVGEGDGATTLSVTATLNGIALAADTAVALTVRALTADATDFAASTVTLTIPSGQRSGAADLTLTPAGDDVDEGDETVAVEGAVAGLAVTADTVTIADDDTRGVAVSGRALAVSEGDSAAYTVVLESAPTDTVTIAVSVTGDADVTASPEGLTFTANDWSTAQTVTVRSAADDDVADDAATVTHAVSGGDYGANNVAAEPVTVTVDDDVGNHPATGLPAISGTARVGDTLTASVDEIEDENGLENATFLYQWLSNNGTEDMEIANATDSTYKLVPADAGKTIKVRVTFTDDGGAQETRVSAATDPVAAAAPSVLSVADADATEEQDSTLVFVVTLNPAAGDTVTVDYATSDGTATAGEDYTATSGTLTFLAGDTTKTISVLITDDAVDDGGETFTLTLSNAAGASLGDPKATGTIRNTETTAELSAGFPGSAYTSKRHAGSGDRPQVVVAFSAAVAAFAANTPSVSVTGASGLSVQAHTEDGLENAYVFFMTPDGDGDVTFALVADSACASGGICTTGGTVLTQVPAALTIPGPTPDPSSLSVADADATEEQDSTLVFVVTLDPAAGDTVTVDYATADGTATAGEDYTAASGTLTFLAGDTAKSISVPVIDDAVDDGGETFTLALSNVSSGIQLGDSTATGTINDNDETLPALSVSDASANEGDSVAFTVSLSAAAGEQVRVEYATSDGTATSGSDYTAESGTLTFTAGETSKTVGVATTDDSVDEDDETFMLTLSSPGNATLGDAAATGTINDDDNPSALTGFTLVDAGTDTDIGPIANGASFTFADPANGSYGIRAEPAAGAEIGSVRLALSGAATASRTENIAPYSLYGDDGVNVAGEGLPAGSYSLTAKAYSEARLGGQEIGSLAVSFTVVAAELPALAVSDASAAEGDAVAFKVSLSPAAGEQVTVQYATSGGTATSGTDFTAVSGTLTFAANQTSKTVSVATTDDSVDEDDETFTLTLSSPANATLGDATATGTINDDDETLPALSVSDASAAEGDAVAFKVSLSPAAGEQVTVQYATSGGTATSGTDFTAESGTLTFAAGETSKTVGIATTEDTMDEDDETFTLTLSSPANATLADGTATGTILDDDDAAPLTASFSNMPASHTGEEFTFGLAFSENVRLSYVTLRDTAFVVTGGDVRIAKRQQQGSNQAWNITVKPTSASDTVTITLPETTDCSAVNAICTKEDPARPLSHSLSATVLDAASSTAGDAANGDVVVDDDLDDALALVDGVTPDEAAAALVGEATLSEGQLNALDRLGNRNGLYDLGDVLSWRDRCGRGEARCGGSTDPGPASSALFLFGAAAAGRRRTPRSARRRGAGRRPARRGACALALLLAASTSWSCTGDLVGPPAAERDPAPHLPAPATAPRGPGLLTVEWTAPAAGRAIGVLLELEGPGIEAVVGAAGTQVYHFAASGRHRIVVAGPLESGPLLGFRVPDRGQLPLYRVRVLQVTEEDYGLGDTGEYRAVASPN